MPNTYWQDYFPVVDGLYASLNLKEMFLPPKTDSFWNADTIKEESAKLGLIPRSQIWLCLTLINHQSKVRWVQLAHKTITKEFHDNLDKQHKMETKADTEFPLSEQFIVGEADYPTAPQLREHELQAVLDAIDELVESINNPENDEWNTDKERVLFRDVFCPDSKNLTGDERLVWDEHGRPYNDSDRDSDFI